MREVVPVRLGEAEREQIARAAALRKLPLSSFIRQAALQASALVQGKASVKAQTRPPAERESTGLVVIESEPAGHWVEGEWVNW